MGKEQDQYEKHLKVASREIQSALLLLKGSDLTRQEKRKVLRELDPILMLIKRSGRVKLEKKKQEDTRKKSRGKDNGTKRRREAN